MKHLLTSFYGAVINSDSAQTVFKTFSRLLLLLRVTGTLQKASQAQLQEKKQYLTYSTKSVYLKKIITKYKTLLFRDTLILLYAKQDQQRMLAN